MSSSPIQNLEQTQAAAMPTAQTPFQKGVRFLEQKGKLELWAGTIAARGLAFGQKQQELNQSAEDAYTRRTIWGEKAEQQKSGEDMGGHTILGDIIVPSQPQQQPQQPQGSGLGKVLAGAALGASLLGMPAGVAGYLLSQMNQQKAVQPAPVVLPTPSAGEGETVDLGLKKIEDLEL